MTHETSTRRRDAQVTARDRQGRGFGLDAAGGGLDRKRILDTFAECLRWVRAEPAKTPPAHGRSGF